MTKDRAAPDDGCTMKHTEKPPDAVPSAGRYDAAVSTVSSARRAVWILIVLVAPVVWGIVAVVGPPSDSTLVYPSSAIVAPDGRWSDSAGLPLGAVYGDSPLASIWKARGEDEVRVTAIGGVYPQTEARRDLGAPRIGDTYRYTVRVGNSSETQSVPVTLGRYPLADAVTDNWGSLALWVSLWTAGSFVFWRRPQDPAARTLLALAAVVPMGMTAFPFGLQAIDVAGGRSMWAYLTGEVANCLAWGFMLLFALVFPAPSTWLRRHPVLLAAPLALPFVLYAAVVPLVAAGRPAGLARLEVLLLVSTPASIIVIPLITVILLWRTVLAGSKDEPREHQLALRIVLLSIAVPLVTYVALTQVPKLLGDERQLTLTWAPVALLAPPGGIILAVLRYHLYEVDLIIRRSLLAGLVLTFGVLAFAGITTGLSPRLTHNGTAALLIGGVLTATLLPLGYWTWRRLNRLVFGARDDPHRVVADLRSIGTTAGTEEALTAALNVLSETLRLSYAAVEVDATAGVEPINTAVGRPHPRPTVIELKSHGHPWGRLTLGVSARREPFGPRDRKLLDNVGAQIGALAQGLVMNLALRRSRERVITAREEERRRIRRDLHDGLGPALATMGMQLEYVRDLLVSAPELADDALARLVSDNDAQIGEIRRLVDDLRPRTLDQFGLVTALRQHAAGTTLDSPTLTVPSPTRARMRWSVEAGDVEPLSAAVEVAAYRIVLEAVTNAAKHSHADTCRVTLDREAESLRVVVSDDGLGLPVDPTLGVGLRSMRERAEELGGTFDITSNGRGTTLVARLPLTSP